MNPNSFRQTTFWFKGTRPCGELAAAIVIVLSSCQPQNVREEKALRSQLAHELRNHSYESAVPLARHVIKIAPQDNNAWKHLVQAQIGLHDFDGARQTLADWRQTVRPPSARPDKFQGDIALEESDFAGALQAWGKALAAQPKNRRVLEKVAALEQRQQRWPDAIATWTRALQVHDTATARINRAVCYRRMRQWNEAFDDLHHAQKLASDDPEVQRWSKLFENVSKFVDQIREFDARVEAISDDPGLLADRALLLIHSGDPELALDDCEKAVKLAPWGMRPRLFKALSLIALNRSKECEKLSIRLPLRLESLTPEFLETISRIDSAISVERDNPDHYAARAWQLNEIGQPLLAFEDAQTAIRLDSKSASGWAEISYALTKLGRGQEAWEKIKQATELDPNLVSAWQYRGELEMARGDNMAAIDSLTHALAIQRTAAGLQKREECYRRLGLNARADEDHRAWQELTSRTLK